MPGIEWHLGKARLELESLEVVGDSFILNGTVSLTIDSLNALLRSFIRPPFGLEVISRNGKSFLAARYNGFRVVASFSLSPRERGVELTMDEVYLFDLVPLRGIILDLFEELVFKFVRFPFCRRSDSRLFFDLESLFPKFAGTKIRNIAVRDEEIVLTFSKKKEGGETKRTQGH